MSICISNSGEENSKNPFSVGCVESLLTIKNYYHARKQNGDKYFNKFLDESSGQIEESILYHRKCYQNFTNNKVVYM